MAQAKLKLTFCFTALLTCLLVFSVNARAGFIRDAEVERLLWDYTNPLVGAAGLNRNNLQIGVISDPRINAFVAGGQNIFFHTGLITEAEEPNMVIGVIAHELGHITGGHLARSGEAMARASRPALIATILGLGSLLGGAPDLGMALITGGQQLSLASYLTYSRAQEASADQTALRLLDATHQSARGIIDLMNSLADQEILSEASQDPFMRSHPMSRDRVHAYEASAKKSPYFNTRDPAELQFRHDMVKGKLDGFINHPQSVLRARKSDSAPDRYARAIALHRLAQREESIALIDGLLADFPENPWLWELRGQVLYESGLVEEAIPSYRKSLVYAPREPLLMIGLAASLMATDQNTSTPRYNEEVITLLRDTLRIETDNVPAYMQLSKAYGQSGDIGLAEWAVAEYYALRGDRSAIQHAQKAIKLLKPGQSERLRALDIANSDFR